jgi:hypothetical protein
VTDDHREGRGQVDISHLPGACFFGHIGSDDPALVMRPIVAVLMLMIALFPARPAKAQGCTDDDMSVDTIMATILEIVPAPEPFVSADILLRGPDGCPRLWMYVLKSEAVECRVGDRVEARGIVIRDPENNAWNIHPTQDEHMRLYQDYTCTR